MIAQPGSANEFENDVLFELEEIVVGNMPFSLRDYEYAVASESDVVQLAEATYRNVVKSPDGRIYRPLDE